MKFIVETNLKKQGILPATFSDPKDYDLIDQDASLSTEGLTDLAPKSTLTLVVTPKSGTPFKLQLNHTMSADQIQWFKAGSALNMIAQQAHL